MDNISHITQPKLESWRKDVHSKIVDTINYATQGLGLDLNNDRQKIIERCIDALVASEELHCIPTAKNIITKDNSISSTYQAEGKLHYDNKKYAESWISYTKAIAYALPGSLELAHAYLYRSDALFKAEMYDDCTKDLFKFKKIFPGNPRLLTNSRELKIEDEKEKKGARSFKFIPEINAIILKGKNPEVRSLSDSTQLNYSHEYGRYITAKKDIKLGEVIGVERAYASNIVEDLKYNLCNYCKKQTWSSIPCNNCAHVVYCSESCKAFAYQEYHKVECKIIPYLLAFGIKDKYLLTLRIAIMGILESHPDKIPTNQDLLSFEPRIRDSGVVLNPESSRRAGFISAQLRSDAFTSVLSLQSSISKKLINQECVSLADCFIMAYYLLINMDYLSSDHKGDLKDLKKHEKFMNVVRLLDKSVRILANNALEVSMPQADKINEQIYLGSALVVPFSLFNHSCQPMVIITRHTDLNGSQFVMRASCPIEEGQQIFTNYGVKWYCQDKKKRQDILNLFYNFTCKCDACCNDWTHTGHIYEDIVDIEERKEIIKIIKNFKAFIKSCQSKNTSLYYLSRNKLMAKPGDLIVNYSDLGKFHEYFVIYSPEAVELSQLFDQFFDLTQVPFIQFVKCLKFI